MSTTSNSSSLSAIWIPISALLLSDAFLLIGHGLLLTLLPVAADNEGFSHFQIAITGSAYFLGFVSGCFITPLMLKRVGHIRSFAALATLYSAIVLVFPWFPKFFIWLLLRFIIGAAISGLYMIIESWLNERASTHNRGTILSVYTMLNLVMITVGQQLLNVGSISSHQLFGLAAILISIAIIPVSLTLSLAPAATKAVRINLPKLWRQSFVGWFSAVSAGLVTGAFWALAPIYARLSGFDNIQLSLFISATVLGGAVFQIPLGKLSDHYDRRIVLMYAACSGAIISLVLTFLPYVSQTFGGWPATVLSFFWGGMVMTQYAIGLAHANDNAQSDNFVQTGSGMLFTLGIFSALGAPLASLFMRFFSASGLYLFAAISLTSFTVIIVFRRRHHELPYATDEVESFQAITDTATPGAFAMDPRAENSSIQDEDASAVS